MEYEYYNFNNLIDNTSRSRMIKDIDTVIAAGDYWKNSPPYQTSINIFGLPTEDWVNLKISFIWSCFAYMKQERKIKTIKSWAYKTNLATTENRDMYWHQHLREGSLVLSGVYYLQLTADTMPMGGTELAYDKPDGPTEFCPGKVGHWIIFPGKTWHRPGIIEGTDWRYIVAADMEI